jgi:hypothetical protein
MYASLIQIKANWCFQPETMSATQALTPRHRIGLPAGGSELNENSLILV